MGHILVNKTISTLYRYNQRFFSQKLREKNIPVELGHIPFLMQVYRHPGITQDGISAITGMDKGTTAKCIKQMEKLGFIVRKTDALDKRVNHVYITSLAMEFRDELFQMIEDLHSVLYQGFQEQDIETVNSFLEKMMDNVTSYLK